MTKSFGNTEHKAEHCSKCGGVEGVEGDEISLGLKFIQIYIILYLIFIT